MRRDAYSSVLCFFTHGSKQLILNTELARFGTRGFVDGMLNGAVIGLPPIWNYGSPELQAKVIPEVRFWRPHLPADLIE